LYETSAIENNQALHVPIDDEPKHQLAYVLLKLAGHGFGMPHIAVHLPNDRPNG
jgi:hypothetical protein